jgi:hypothetical protein
LAVKPEAVFSASQYITALSWNVNVACPPFRSEYGPLVGWPLSPCVYALAGIGLTRESSESARALTAAIAISGRVQLLEGTVWTRVFTSVS